MRRLLRIATSPRVLHAMTAAFAELHPGGIGVEGAPAARTDRICPETESWFPGAVAEVAYGAELCSN